MNYNKYQHIERLGSAEVEGILEGLCYVFPKLDGTNSQLWWNNGLKAGSRNRELSVESDNAGFYNWALTQSNILSFFENRPDLKLYGEWLVPHTLKNYNSNAWRNFYVFDVIREDGSYLPYEEYNALLSIYGIPTIPVLLVKTNPSLSELNELLSNNTYLISEGIGEGIVIKNYNYTNKYGRKTWAKIVADEFKVQKGISVKDISEQKPIEFQIVETFVTEAFVRKELAKIELVEPWSSKLIPKLLNTVFHELIAEEMWNILKRFKNPKINFKDLNNLTISKIKELLSDKF